MRLIDADAFIARLDYVPMVKDAIKKAMDHMPTIDPKKGKWIEDAETYYKSVNEKGGGVNENTTIFTDDIACSECLTLFSVIDNETEHFNYCPNCLADMRGDKE